MKKYLLLLVLFSGIVAEAVAQKELLAQNPALDTIPQTFGPNLKYYTHFYAGFGFVAGSAEEAGSRTRPGLSHEWLFGVRFKYKIAEVLAVGAEAHLNPQTFYLKQVAGKTLPNPVLHKMEKFKFTNIGLGAYTRINYDKRGNYMGNFIDIGAYGNWMPFNAHIFRDKATSVYSGAKEQKIRFTGLKYIADFNYGLLARAGFNRYVFYGSYRLSDLFDTGYTVINGQGVNHFDFAELPRFTVGFQLSMHK